MRGGGVPQTNAFEGGAAVMRSMRKDCVSSCSAPLNQRNFCDRCLVSEISECDNDSND